MSVFALVAAAFALAAGPGPGAAAAAAHRAGPPAPRIVQRPIPFPARRVRETAAYAQRHYGVASALLAHPHVIVEHYTETTTFSSVFNTFADDVPDIELHELPQVCSHFVIDTDGTIYQLVSLRLICRHTVGLNWTAIGIENVGMSDAEILGRPRQLAAMLKLTRWLRCRYGIPVGDVIGHNESLTSPYHRERVAALRTQTHDDFRRADMNVFRRKLAAAGLCSAG